MTTLIVLALGFVAVPAVFWAASEVAKNQKWTESLRRLHLL